MKVIRVPEAETQHLHDEARDDRGIVFTRCGAAAARENLVTTDQTCRTCEHCLATLPELTAGTVVKIGGRPYRLLTGASTYGDDFAGIDVSFEVASVDTMRDRGVL